MADDQNTGDELDNLNDLITIEARMNFMGR